MSRYRVALTILALAGAAFVLPEASARSFGFSAGARAGGFRAPLAAQRNASHRFPRAYAAILQRPFIGPGSRPAVHVAAHGLGRDMGSDLRARFVRRLHHGSIAGYVYPFTSEGFDAPYLGTPYDPAEAIPVYAPAAVYPVPADDDDAAPPSRRLVPRQSNLRDENQDACRSERVTVPETSGEGEREILVVRC